MRRLLALLAFIGLAACDTAVPDARFAPPLPDAGPPPDAKPPDAPPPPVDAPTP